MIKTTVKLFFTVSVGCDADYVAKHTKVIAKKKKTGKGIAHGVTDMERRLRMNNLTYAFLKSISALTIFAGMACYFHKWWLVLFAIFYLVFIENKNKECNDEQ